MSQHTVDFFYRNEYIVFRKFVKLPRFSKFGDLTAKSRNEPIFLIFQSYQNSSKWAFQQIKNIFLSATKIATRLEKESGEFRNAHSETTSES